MPPYAGLLGGVREQRGSAPVHGVLAVVPAARPGARGEDRDVRPGQHLGDRVGVGLLQIQYGGLPAGRGDIRLVIGVANQPDHLVSVTAQQLGQPKSDLSVSTRNHDSHVPEPSSRRADWVGAVCNST